MLAALLSLQALLTFSCEGEGPVRFGVPLPMDELAEGLRLSQPRARLQWRALHDAADPVTGRLWVELCVEGVVGRASVYAGGRGSVGPTPLPGGGVCTVVDARENAGGVEVDRRRWRWGCGAIDERSRQRFVKAGQLFDEEFEPGEFWTEASEALDGRWLRVRIDPGWWHRAGVLPHHGRLARSERARLVGLARDLPAAPGRRGRGDHVRDGDVVTNLEFDTTLALARLGLATGDAGLLRDALAAARHLVDRDLEPRTGLPFQHGPDHRVVGPEPGHTWIEGLLLVGCLAADDALIGAARGIAHGLARHPPQGQGRNDRARNFGWPLLAMECWLRFEAIATVARAADRLGAALLGRWDPTAGVLRFGEGERRRGYYEERLWITGGVMLPALRAHAERRPGPQVDAVIAALEGRIGALVLNGRKGLPVRCWVRDGVVTGAMRLSGVPETFMVLEGVAPSLVARAVQRRIVRRALRCVPAEDDPRLATSLTIAGRCAWLMR